jgi:hypothetical protein
MRIALKLAAFVLAVAATAVTGQAAVLNFAGSATGGSLSPVQAAGFLAGATAFELSVTYDESATNSANVTASELKIKLAGGGERIFTGGTSGTLNILSGNKDLKVTVNYFNFGAAAGEPVNGNLDITFTKLTALGSGSVTAANVSQIFVPLTTYQGNIYNGLILGSPNLNGSANLAGFIPVPEPGSVGLLAGLGMVAGRKVWRRRQQKKAESAV